MKVTQLEHFLEKYELTYEQFADELNEFAGRELISNKRKRGMVSDWVNGRRNIGPAMQFAIERFFQEKYRTADNTATDEPL